MRAGYPTGKTFAEEFRILLLTAPAEVRAHWQTIAETRVDGLPFADTEVRRRSPSPHDTRLSEKLSEVLLASHAFAQLGARDVDIDTGGAQRRESPDLVVAADGKRLGVEVREVIPNAHAENVCAEFNIELRDRMDADPTLRPAYTYLQISRRAGRGAPGALAPEVREQLMKCVLEYLRSGDYASAVADKWTHRMAWPGASLGYDVWIRRVPNPNGYVTFDDQRGSFDSHGMIEPALDGLRKKRERAATYDHTFPLWLVLGVTEQWGQFRSSLEYLATLSPAIQPFERVIIHDGGTYVTYSAHGAQLG
jgi:hypothetical protein